MLNKKFLQLIVSVVIIGGLFLSGCDLKEEGRILDFSLNEQIGESSIDISSRTVIIDVNAGTDVSALEPLIEITAGYTITPESQEVVDFSEGSVTYLLKNQETGQERLWTVKVMYSYIFYEDFSNHVTPITYSTSPVSGTNTETRYLEIVNDNESDNKYLKIVDYDKWATHTHVQFPEQTTNFIIEFDIMFENISGSIFSFYLKNDTTLSIDGAGGYMNSSRILTLARANGTSNVPLPYALDENVWHHVKMLVKPESQKYDIYVTTNGNTQEYLDADFRTSSYEISVLYLFTAGNDAHGYLMLDNIKVY